MKSKSYLNEVTFGKMGKSEGKQKAYFFPMRVIKKAKSRKCGLQRAN